MYNDSKWKRQRDSYNPCLICEGDLSADFMFVTVENYKKSLKGIFKGVDLIQSVVFLYANDDEENKCVNTEITDFSYMFSGCRNLEEVYILQNPFVNAINLSNMFSNCINLRNFILGDYFNINKVVSIDGMFSGCSSLEKINLSKLETKSIKKYDENNRFKYKVHHGSLKNISKIFSGCVKLKVCILPNFSGTRLMEDMSNMFSGCSSLESLDFSSFNTSRVINMSYMFYGCSSLKELNVSNFNTKNVTNMSYMFCGCSSLKELNVSDFNTNNVTDMGDMFYECSSLKELNLYNFYTNNVTDMARMFCGCSSLKELNLSNFNTNNVTYMGGMFYRCSNDLIMKIKTQYKNIKKEAFGN